MDDLVILAIGRQFIEMAVQREQLHQALKKAQETDNKSTSPSPNVS